jgi:glycerophosphoryl diester phosphodiesterase
VKRKSTEQHRNIGIYPEAKHPSYFSNLGLSNEQPIIDLLNKNGYADGALPVFIQCFETATLKRLHKLTSYPLIQLIDEDTVPYDWVEKHDRRKVADMLTPEGLKEIASYAQGVGPNKNLIAPRDKSGKLLKPTTLIEDAHNAGLKVHPWTFRNENSFQPLDFRQGENDSDYGRAFAEYKMFYDLGVDGVFSENPDTALEARDGHLLQTHSAGGSGHSPDVKASGKTSAQ